MAVSRSAAMIYNRQMVPVTIETDDRYHYLQTPFGLKDEVKAMRGARWMGYDNDNPRPLWRVDRCPRNDFNISYLEAKNPFARWKAPLVDKDGQGFHLREYRTNWHNEEIKIYSHQNQMTLHMLIRKWCIVAGEMGVGKTLSAFEAMELSLVPQVWYVAPKSALTSVKLEYARWKCRTATRFMTYDELKKVIANWVPGEKPPRMVIFDESSKVKTPGSQRTQVAQHLADSMRDAWGENCYIILMSGSPAPKSPLDWYMQCEIACPGYIKEGDIHKFHRSLAILERVGDTGGVKYSRLIAWRDGNPNICGAIIDQKEGLMCGKHLNAHDPLFGHQFTPVDNQIERLYKRISGLALVIFKKDCLDLPEKIYRVMKLKATLDLIRAARIVMSQAKTVIQSLTLQRELSDGFQYRDKIIGTEPCEVCKGRKIIFNESGDEAPCMFCNAVGHINTIERETIEVESPKLAAVTDLLEENEEVGRIVLYAGFTASIDRLCKHVKSLGWEFIRVDGRGWTSSINPTWNDMDCLREFQDGNKDRNIAFIGHPGSAGMGLTLTAASMIVYVSNDFNAESRIQSEDRVHRAGMDVNRGATIVDLILLPTDAKVLENLKRKRELQSISLGELQQAMDNFDYNSETVS